jgi:hypothetical protein
MIDLKPVFINAFIPMFESLLWLQATAFVVSLFIIVFIDKISDMFKLKKRQKKKLKGNSMFIIFFLVTIEIVYVVVK